MVGPKRPSVEDWSIPSHLEMQQTIPSLQQTWVRGWHGPWKDSTSPGDALTPGPPCFFQGGLFRPGGSVVVSDCAVQVVHMQK